MEIKLGNKVKCRVTGFEGIAVARVEYINGCVQFGVKPNTGADNKMPEAEYIDICQLKYVDEGVKITPFDTGGPQRDCPKH